MDRLARQDPTRHSDSAGLVDAHDGLAVVQLVAKLRACVLRPFRIFKESHGLVTAVLAKPIFDHAELQSECEQDCAVLVRQDVAEFLYQKRQVTALFRNNSSMADKRTLIIDDEADCASIGYAKKAGLIEANKIASKDKYIADLNSKGHPFRRSQQHRICCISSRPRSKSRILLNSNPPDQVYRAGTAGSNASAIAIMTRCR